MRRISLAVIILLCLAGIVGAQFPIGGTIVWDIVNEPHFLAQLSQLIQQYNQLVLTYKQIQYNATILNNKARWNLTMNNWVLTQSRDTYGYNSWWSGAMNTGLGTSYAYMNSTEALNRYGLANVPPAFQPLVTRQYAQLELQDGTHQMAMQTVGQYKGEEKQRNAAITTLGNTIGSDSASTNSEVASLGAISSASILNLQTAHSNTAINAAILEQMTVEGVQRRQAQAYAINADIEFRDQAPVMAAKHTTSTTTALQSLRIP